MSPPRKDAPVARRSLEIKNRLGLHARAAAQFVQTLAKYDVTVTVTKEDQVVDGRSIIGLMMLAAAQGSTIEVAIEGPDAPAAMAALVRLIDEKFNEE